MSDRIETGDYIVQVDPGGGGVWMRVRSLDAMGGGIKWPMVEVKMMPEQARTIGQALIDWADEYGQGSGWYAEGWVYNQHGDKVPAKKQAVQA